MFHCANAKGHETAQRRAGQPSLTLASMLSYLSKETIKNGVQLAAQLSSGTPTSRTAKITYPDNDCFIPLELGDISVAPGHLGTVEGPETAHHFDGALCRVGHLPRFTNGNSPTKQPKKIKIKCILDPRNGRAGAEREAEPLVSDLRFRKE